MNKIWYVGKRISDTEWEMQGIFTHKDKAIDAVIQSNCTECFIVSIPINTMLPIQTINIEDFGGISWYPLLENEPTEK